MATGVLIVALALTTQTAKEMGWKEFTSKEGGFSVHLPTNPDMEKRRTEKGEVISWTGVSGVRYYRVGKTPAPPGLSEKGKQSFLDFLRDDTTKTLHAELIREKEISLDGYPGKEFTIEGNSPLDRDKKPDVPEVGRIRNFVVGNAIYTVSVYYPKGTDSALQVKALFDSFKLTD